MYESEIESSQRVNVPRCTACGHYIIKDSDEVLVDSWPFHKWCIRDKSLPGSELGSIEDHKQRRALEEILYKLARLVRNRNGLHPSTQGMRLGQVLAQLRALDVERYDKEVLG